MLIPAGLLAIEVACVVPVGACRKRLCVLSIITIPITGFPALDPTPAPTTGKRRAPTPIGLPLRFRFIMPVAGSFLFLFLWLVFLLPVHTTFFLCMPVAVSGSLSPIAFV